MFNKLLSLSIVLCSILCNYSEASGIQIITVRINGDNSISLASKAKEVLNCCKDSRRITEKFNKISKGYCVTDSIYKDWSESTLTFSNFHNTVNRYALALESYSSSLRNIEFDVTSGGTEIPIFITKNIDSVNFSVRNGNGDIHIQKMSNIGRNQLKFKCNTNVYLAEGSYGKDSYAKIQFEKTKEKSYMTLDPLEIWKSNKGEVRHLSRFGAAFV